ncbi:hypothetical protein PTTG_06080 [Puccinia triticina 1-1 BBBD Race 1]|uniref:Uncharacterized protein n=1 Tax=Puccinia triticina (isolate 1-1 / race 1 (BBBD)) TaxID=630390 RepID=A0A180G3A7_PUCT1|nr:hypothetical protein PTTG_06080 [Puccinia triticina 1-1 BBBD Race 1]
MDLQSTRKLCFQNNGKPPIGGRKLNSLYSSILPKSTSPLCCSIYLLTQTLLELNLKVPSDAWKQIPSPDNLNSASSLPDSILLHPINPIEATTSNPVSEKIPPIYRPIFLKDLDRSGFPGWKFAWEEPWDARWNQLLCKFILKHWRYAHKTGALQGFHLDPNETSDKIICTGILHRWFLGRQEGLRLGRFLPKRRGEKKQSEKKSKLQLQVRNQSK